MTLRIYTEPTSDQGGIWAFKPFAMVHVCWVSELDYHKALDRVEAAEAHTETYRAQVDATLKDRAFIISERDRTFALMLDRAEAAEAERDALAAEVLRLRAKVDALEEALEFYTDLSHEGPWHLPGEDYGKRARAALAAWEATTKGERK